MGKLASIILICICFQAISCGPTTISLYSWNTVMNDLSQDVKIQEIQIQGSLEECSTALSKLENELSEKITKSNADLNQYIYSVRSFIGYMLDRPDANSGLIKSCLNIEKYKAELLQLDQVFQCDPKINISLLHYKISQLEELISKNQNIFKSCQDINLFNDDIKFRACIKNALFEINDSKETIHNFVMQRINSTKEGTLNCITNVLNGISNIGELATNANNCFIKH